MPTVRRSAAALLLLLLLSAGRVADALLTPKARGLTLEEIFSMIQSEVEFDFDTTEGALVSRLWDASNEFEWEKALGDELLLDRKYPYLLCNTFRKASGRRISGYERSDMLREEIESHFGEEHGESDRRYYLRTLYNEEDYYCAYGQLPATVASEIEGEEYIVQPVTASLKMMKGSVDRMQKAEIFADPAAEPTLDVLLCPGVAMKGDVMPAGDGASEESGETTTITIEDVDSPEGTAETSFILETDEEEIPDWMVRDILSELMPTTVASKLASAMEETVFLLSEAYGNRTSPVAAGDDPEDVAAANSRSKLWKGLVSDYQKSGMCDAVYSSRLSWSVVRASDPDNDSSVVHVRFNATGASEYDAGCLMTLSLAIANHPDVCTVELRERFKTANHIARWLTQSEVQDSTPFLDAGIDGSGQVVAISDTGVDLDHCYFRDGGGNAPGRGSVNLAARKVVQYVPFVNDDDYKYGHGTHVAGTAAGKRLDGTGMAEGAAPAAKIAFADVGDSAGNLRLPLDRQLLQTGRPHAQVHSASWGSDFNFYTTQARNFDQHMFENDEFLIVVAAGNSGHGDAPNTVGSPATAKNVIAVGAHHSTGGSNPRGSLGPSYIADFSSRGPTSDGRTKPDILATGMAVVSAGALPDVFGECDPSRPPSPGGKSDGLLSLQGTSMAAPLVSGTALLVRQYFVDGYYPTGARDGTAPLVSNPTGALIKAVIMNSGQWLTGVDNGAAGVTPVAPYDNAQNFGRLSLQDALYLPGRTNMQITAFDRRAVEDGTSVSETVVVDKSDGCAYDKLVVTLVWTEPGSQPGCTRCVLNDLDLTVTIDGKTYYPNGRDGPDDVNNAERVVVKGVPDGTEAVITVEASNLIQRYQQYSLVATGCFGGVANTNFEDQCSAFDCDTSYSKRRNTIIMAICIPAGVLLLCGGWFCYRRRKESG
mmetsp:Transcript_36292/g.86501  ORF Transcript_36292/g.86501 Transcript_36292/m.86501 type:complete len:936 (-) Transcript_36292:74-2881(-)